MRPQIFTRATQLGLGGWVNNQGTAVVMEIAGYKKNIKVFLNSILHDPPQGSEIHQIKIESRCYAAYNGFSIINSSTNDQIQGFIPPDTAICDQCIKEIQDKTNRRAMYPFANCTSCGPRYSIISKLPYDRFNTSMSAFEMCPACRSEYENPDNRRFHAQTNCCPDCGPKLVLLNSEGTPIDNVHPIATTRQLLQEGRIIAVKGIGGYHLACNAEDEMAVDRLRGRKRRPDKPLAIMAASLEAVRTICKTSDKEEEILTGRQRPIVLLEKKYPEYLPPNIAPWIHRLGVMLPYTPLHYLLIQQTLQYLVMTSGNVSGMPICYKDEEALKKLNNIADFFLVHDRKILAPTDDSVVRVVQEQEMVSRSGRGYSPYSLQIDSDSEILAVGAEQKSSICLLHQGYAHSSQYLGNLEDMNTYEEYLQVMDRMKGLLGAAPQIIAHDLLPGYLSTQWAIKQSAVRIPVQHHQAHMAACMGEHGLKRNAIGIIYDGTGMGTDGAIWGGEFFVGSNGIFSRVGHWKYVTIQGGDSAVKEPWKSAASYLYAMGINSGEIMNYMDDAKVRAIQMALKHHVNCFQSSSIGRLFDCVGALIMKKINITYDAQAAIELESVIMPDVSDYYIYSIDEKDEQLEIGYEEILSGILNDMKEAKAASYIAAKFHNTVCSATIDCVCKVRDRYGLNDVVFGGGVFENAYLLKNMMLGLQEKDFIVYHNMKVPANDGGIAFGQAVVVSQRLSRLFLKEEP